MKAKLEKWAAAKSIDDTLDYLTRTFPAYVVQIRATLIACDRLKKPRKRYIVLLHDDDEQIPHEENVVAESP